MHLQRWGKDLIGFVGWGERIRTSVLSSKGWCPATGRPPNLPAADRLLNNSSIPDVRRHGIPAKREKRRSKRDAVANQRFDKLQIGIIN